jgi:hypothetical protein
MDTKLILFSGTSGAGKSTTSKALAGHLERNGIQHLWIHEEANDHPIRDGEFGHGELANSTDMQKNIDEMFERWKRLVGTIMKQDAVYVMEGVLYENISRYLARAQYPTDRIQDYYDALMDIIAPTNPTVVHLYRGDIKQTLRCLSETRGKGWLDSQLDWQWYPDMPADTELTGDDAVYALWHADQDKAQSNFERYTGSKVWLCTDEGRWEDYIQELTQHLGIEYRRPARPELPNPEIYLGRYEVCNGDKTEAVEIKHDAAGLYCHGFWPCMRLDPMGPDHFAFLSFPMEIQFSRSKNEMSLRVSGSCGWKMVGKTLRRSD